MGYHSDPTVLVHPETHGTVDLTRPRAGSSHLMPKLAHGVEDEDFVSKPVSDNYGTVRAKIGGSCFTKRERTAVGVKGGQDNQVQRVP